MTAEACPVCGKCGEYRVIGKIASGRRIISCACGLQSISPLPTEDERREIYQEGYYDFWGAGKDFRQLFNLKLKTCRKLINKANKLFSEIPGRKHLDIGSAFGYMIEAARTAGFYSQGIEISPAADVAVKLGYDVKRVLLEDAAFPAESFDLITAIDVIEHIPDPVRWLRECRRIIKKEGVLLLVTPDCSSLPALLKKSSWPHYKAEHLFYYSPRTLRRLLSDAGFDKIRSNTGLRYLTLNYVANHYEQFQPYSFETKVLKMLRSLFPRIIFECPLPFPSEMVVVARRT